MTAVQNVPCPKCANWPTLAPCYPGDFSDCPQCGHTWQPPAYKQFPSKPAPVPMSQGMKIWGGISLVFLCLIFPPFIIVVLIWGIVKVATKK